jgi:Ser/Thr protein kinase RdoA (MazF antagonist)
MPSFFSPRSKPPLPVPTTEQFIEAAAAVSYRWGLQPRSVDVMSHSENVVCDVELANDRHLVMRLHRPGYNTIEELRSEVQWVASLANACIPVPQPMSTIDGEHYVSVRVGGEDRYVGVIDWVEGRPLGGPVSSGGEDVVPRYGRIGEIAAAIRIHNATWDQPRSFVRRRWDADGLVGQNPLWGRFWEVDALTDHQRDLFASARAELHRKLSSLSTGSDRFGLIHADLHLGNLMADGEQLTVIDFDDAGFGWFSHELAVALHPVLNEPTFPEARKALLTGYRRSHPLADDEIQLIDAFLTIRCLMIVSWLNDRPELPMRQYFGDLVTQAEQITTRYLEQGFL